VSREGRSRWGFNQRFVIGRQDNPMMERWHLIQTPLFGVYVHFVYREDLDPYPHDHPWRFLRMVLRGGYTEEWLKDPVWAKRPVLRDVRRLCPSVFPTTSAHRIRSVSPGTVSLVLVGRKRRSWGFWRPTGLPPSTYGDLLAAALGASVEVRGVRELVDYRDALGLRPNEGVSE
jgi:hypothetical protein